MRNAILFPNRILYREELLSTTVTYAVDLSEAEFWNLKPVMPIEELGIRPGTGAGDDRLSQGQQMVLDASTAERIQVFIRTRILERRVLLYKDLNSRSSV